MLLPGGSPELQPISVVTGGHTGLGLAIARELIECGSHVVLTSRRAQAATGTAAALRRMLASETKDDVKVVSAYPHSLDVRKGRSVDTFYRYMDERYGGRVDILVNNAAVCPLGWTRSVTQDVWRTTQSMAMTEGALPGMLRRRCVM